MLSQHPFLYFYKSTDTIDERHTSQYISDELLKVIFDLGPEKIHAIITDNAANMKAARTTIQETHPHITPIGCAAHGLSLLSEDIININSMNSLFKSAKKNVKHIKKRQVISATFTSKEKGRNKTLSLKLPCETKWGAVVIMYKSLLDGKESLQELAIMESLSIEADIRKILLCNDIFWTRLTNTLKLIEPKAQAITEV
ncbi:hypothetical protein SNE40_018301 [Patella caerulea]|uniref:DUF659 domain-containing protein n=1 Tax=Patella caerulea TaxID=87958 RepID=A0AAN8J820_PATCE